MNAAVQTAPRHFLGLLDLSTAELQAHFGHVGDDEEGARQGSSGRRTPARRQDARHDLRSALDPHPRIVRHRHARTRRRDGHADRRRNATWPGRDHRRHRARAVALCRGDRASHPEPGRLAGHGRRRDHSGHQRPYQAVAPLPGSGRPPDFRGEAWRDPRLQDRLVGRLQQRAVVLDRRFRPLRLHPRHRLPTRIAADKAASQGRPFGRRQDHPSGGARGGGQGCRRRHFRLLGVDGRRGRGPAAESARALPGQSAADAPGRARTPSSCTACRRIGARR